MKHFLALCLAAALIGLSSQQGPGAFSGNIIRGASSYLTAVATSPPSSKTLLSWVTVSGTPTTAETFTFSQDPVSLLATLYDPFNNPVRYSAADGCFIGDASTGAVPQLWTVISWNAQSGSANVVLLVFESLDLSQPDTPISTNNIWLIGKTGTSAVLATMFSVQEPAFPLFHLTTY